MMKKIVLAILFSTIALSNVQAQWTMTGYSPVNVYAPGGSANGTFTLRVEDGDGLGTGAGEVRFVIGSGSSGLNLTAMSISPGGPGVFLGGSGRGGELRVVGPFVDGGTYTITYTLTDNGSLTVPPTLSNLNTNLVVSDMVDGQTYNFSNNGNTSLPVTLSSFNVTKEGSKAATLSWKTTEETNSDYFEVQHSLNAKDWEAVGNVQSHNDGKAEHNYTFSYAGKTNGKNYFRLNMVDLDGTSQRSSVKSVTFENLAEEMLSFGPNPTSDYLNIKLSDWSTVKSVSILDKMGRNVYSSGAKPENTISVRNFNSGLYLLKLTRNNGEVIVNKVFVNK
jgi:hypothetical protein